MKDYEKLLKQILDKCDFSKSNQYIEIGFQGSDRYIIQKLIENNYLRRVGNKGPNAVIVEPTYDGIHYFDEQDVSDSYFAIPKTASKKYDVFLSYANKDSKKYIEKLYKELKKLGLNIFYDKESIDWGDEWKERILESTQDSEFAILVISKNYFGREWTERELNEFLSRKNKAGQKIILPIIHGITNKELAEKYPELGKIQTISTKNNNVMEIAIKFAEIFIKRLRDLG